METVKPDTKNLIIGVIMTENKTEKTKNLFKNIRLDAVCQWGAKA